MTIVDEALEELNDGIESAKGSMLNALAKLRTGRANVSILDDVRVDYYGVPTPLSQCAQLSAPEPRMLSVKPWEKAIIGAIEKAIVAAGLGLNPQNDGELIRIPLPALTEERRKELVKQARARGEDAKIAVRNHRRSTNELLKEAEKEKELSQDDLKRALDKVQSVVDQAVTDIDSTLNSKETEILAV